MRDSPLLGPLEVQCPVVRKRLRLLLHERRVFIYANDLGAAIGYSVTGNHASDVIRKLPQHHWIKTPKGTPEVTTVGPRAVWVDVGGAMTVCRRSGYRLHELEQWLARDLVPAVKELLTCKQSKSRASGSA